MHDITKSSRYEQDIRLGARRVSEAGLIAITCSPLFSHKSYSALCRNRGAGHGHRETYWIELIYRDAEHIITGRFTDNEQHLRAASFSADELLSCIKNRNLSKTVLQRVTPPSWWEDIRCRLPDVAYVDIEPPSLIERLRRRLG